MANIVKAAGSSVQSIEKQCELMRLFRLPETMAERYYVRVDNTDDGKGGKKKQYVLCKRDNPVSIFDTGDGRGCVSAVQRTYVERLGGMAVKVDGLSKETAMAVVNNQLCQSVECGEVDSFTSI